MKKLILNIVASLLLLTTFTFEVFSQKQNTVGYKELTGRYANSTTSTVICPCYTQGLFRYFFNGEEQVLTICFDNLQGNVYESFHNEIIKIGGYYINKTCSNGQDYLVFEVDKLTYDDNTKKRQVIATNVANFQEPSIIKPIPKTNSARVRISGSYDSKQGVMSPLSCYGYNIGYLAPELKDANDIIICFDKLPQGEEVNIDCSQNIYVEGYYQDKTISGGGNCSAGTKKILYVTKWNCK